MSMEWKSGKIPTEAPTEYRTNLGTNLGPNIKSGQGQMEETKFGALRESNSGRGRFDLLPYEAIEALAKWYEAGAEKYSERNWENGISVKDCINRMIRHALKAGNGWTDEDHLAAVMWNAAAAITMMQRRPDCNDHIWKNGIDTQKLLDDTDIFSRIQYTEGKLFTQEEEKLIRMTVKECRAFYNSQK